MRHPRHDDTPAGQPQEAARPGGGLYRPPYPRSVRPHDPGLPHPDETPTAAIPVVSAATAPTVHRLRQVHDIAGQAIALIDQALARAS
ncbi:hypothetical protein [Nonomuraea sp. NPDC049709]|uniref:hypothetical protein n=1 Tax=Nonomuraea sp. NPDC049709 TaxID=3154736 RepID=UPI003413039A